MTLELERIIDSFPATFGLRAWPGKTFRIARVYCYVSTDSGPQLVTEVKSGDGWLHFARSTPAELRREVVSL
jgi:hypothetical protein